MLRETDPDPASDDRKLSLVAKPEALPDLTRIAAVNRPSNENGDELIPLARRSVSQAFEQLPNLRARLVTSMFKSASKPVKWIPDGVVSAEIAYEEGRESYGDLHVNGKQPSDAPAAADADYMRSLDKAWSSGDFKTISHCIFSELADSDFDKAGTEQSKGETLAVYEFRGARSSGCVGVNFKSQITYPAYKGSMKVNARSGEVLYVELGAVEIPEAFPLDRAERSVDFSWVQIGSAKYLLPATAYWFGCFRSSYSCFMNRIDFRDYRRFEADSNISFGN